MGNALPIVGVVFFVLCEALSFATRAEDDHDRFASIPPERRRRRKGGLIIKGDGEFTSARASSFPTRAERFRTCGVTGRPRWSGGSVDYFTDAAEVSFSLRNGFTRSIAMRCCEAVSRSRTVTV